MRLAIMLGFLVVTSPLFADTVFAPSKSDNLFLGKGYDPIVGEPRGYCVKPDSEESTGVGSTGTSEHTEIRVVDSFESLRQEIDADVSASARLGLGRVSASMDYLERSEYSSTKVYVLLHSRVENTATALRNPHYTNESLSFLRAKNVAGFRRLCGTEFISTIITGGQFDAVLSIETTSNKDRRDVTLAFSGEYGSAQGSASFKSTFERISGTHHSEVKLVRLGGAKPPGSMDAKILIDYALQFSTLVGGSAANSAVAFEVRTQPYDVVPDDYLDTGTDLRATWLDDIVDNLETALLRKKDVDYAVKHPNQFVGLSLPKARVAAAELGSYLQRLRRAIQACSKRTASDTCPPFSDAIPAADVSLVRYESIEEFRWDMKQRLAVAMPIGLQCRLIDSAGIWYPWSPSSIGSKPCKQVKVAMDSSGSTATADFDDVYTDNSGECLFRFGCLPPSAPR
jgi:hypothetical protein